MISREDIYNYLNGINYPITKQELVKLAKRNSAPKDFIGFLEDLPDDKFCNLADIWPDINIY